MFRISFDSNADGKSFEDLVKLFFSFLKEKNILSNDNHQHIIAVQLNKDGHHSILQNLSENPEYKQNHKIPFINESLNIDKNKTLIFTYDSKNITMTFSSETGNKKDIKQGTEKYVNLDSKSFVFDRNTFNFLKTTSSSLNNLLEMVHKDTTKIISDESDLPTEKIRLKFLNKEFKNPEVQIEKLRSIYQQGEIFFYKKNKDKFRVEAISTRLTCHLNDLISAANIERLNKIPPKNKLAIFNQVVEQLIKRGYPHGDLKPWNIFLRENVENNAIQIKLIDADYAKINGQICNVTGDVGSLNKKINIGDIASDLVDLSISARKLVNEDLGRMLFEISMHLEQIKNDTSLSGCDAILEKIYGTIMQNIAAYVSGIVSTQAAESTILPTAKLINLAIDEIVSENNKLSQRI